MTYLLQVEGLSKSFRGLKALNDLSFSVEEGEIVGIIGPNGAGKTTVLNVISNVYRADSGTILYAGENIVGYAPNRIAKMGLIRTFQSTVSYAESAVWENMIRAQLGHTLSGFWAEFLQTKAVQEKKKAMAEKAEAVLKLLDLDAMANSQAGAMPYGYQKLLGLGIALAGSPRLLMLDEPAAGLNPDESSRLMDCIKKINVSGVTIVLIEHDMKVVMGLCQRVLVINYGELIAAGTPSVIQQNPDVILAYLGEDHEFA